MVINEVYGGGGNSGSAYTNDFIELYNNGAAAQDLTGWSVQYASATGTTWRVTNLSGIIQARQLLPYPGSSREQAEQLRSPHQMIQEVLQ